MKLDLLGTIRSTPRQLMVDGEPCLGVTRANGRRFSIQVVESSNLVDFYDTILHEMLHLFFFIFGAIRNKDVPQAVQHRVIEVVVPFMLNKMAMELAPKRRQKRVKAR